MALEITDGNFAATIAKDQVTVVDLWAEWCGPCKQMTPIINELAVDYEGMAQIGKLNVDENPTVPTNFNVRGIPTFLFFKNGELVDKVVGATTKQSLKDKIDMLMETV